MRCIGVPHLDQTSLLVLEGFVLPNLPISPCSDLAIRTARQFGGSAKTVASARCFSDATELLITVDGGSNCRSPLRKVCLLDLSYGLVELQLVVRHFPQETSKWDKIEH